MSKRVANVLVETLHATGVKTCQGIVGATMNRVVHAVAESEVDWVHMRHEESGAVAEAVNSAKAIPQGKDDDVWDTVAENLA